VVGSSVGWRIRVLGNDLMIDGVGVMHELSIVVHHDGLGGAPQIHKTLRVVF